MMAVTSATDPLYLFHLIARRACTSPRKGRLLSLELHAEILARSQAVLARRREFARTGVWRTK